MSLHATLFAVAATIAAAAPALAQSTQPDAAAAAREVQQLRHRVARLEAEVRYLREQLAHTQLIALAADTNLRLLSPPPPLDATMRRLTAAPQVAIDHTSVQGLVNSMVKVAAAGDAAAAYNLLPPEQRDQVREFDKVSLSAWHNYYQAISLILRNYHDPAKRVQLTYWVHLTLFADDFLRRMDPQASFTVLKQKREKDGTITATIRDESGGTFEMSFVTDKAGRVYQPMPATLGLADPEQVIETARFIRDYFGRLSRELASGKINPANFEPVMAERASEFVARMKALQEKK